MQQAATRVQQVPSSAADGNAAPAVLHSAFVINLTSSTTPVALRRPEHAGLRRFTFFVSRRREEGRERFRLHMGYFDTQEEAEKLLDIVREIYPGAWAGLAPGRGLRGTAPVAPSHDATPAADGTEAARAAGAARPSETRGGAGASAPAAATGRKPQRVDRAPPTAGVASMMSERRARVAGTRQAAAQSLGNVRAAIDALEDSAGAAAAAAMQPVKARTVPTLRPVNSIPTLTPIAPSSAAGATEPAAPKPPPRSLASVPDAAARPAQPARPAREPARALSDRAVLKLLEGSARAARKAPAVAAAPEKPCYAVQLVWSVEPIDLVRVPQLAIFNAYTLYGAQGHRDGRRWYGLRLGFFTDAVSAKQVAQYVRADFATVSVVPVSGRERDQAKRASAPVSAPANPATAVPAPGASRPARATPAPTVSLEEFKFIDDAAMDGAPTPRGEPRSDARPGLSSRPSRGAPGKRAVFRPGRIHAKLKAKSMTLEETLEILGANDLEVEPRGRAAAGGEDAPTPAAPPAGKPSRLSRLFERLSERLGT